MPADTSLTSQELFEQSGRYAEMLERGIGLSGEDQDFFIAGRLRDLRLQLPAGWTPRRVLDFGCGIGRTTAQLARTFPDAELVGVDTSRQAVAAAQVSHGSARIRFRCDPDWSEPPSFDLCHTSGVFHHIRPADRPAALAAIHRALAPGGYFALFENNPWNPGTRLVMKRIPFDRDAEPFSAREARRLLRQAGFAAPGQARFLFYFPRSLAFLRFSEPWLVRLPLGAQYWLLAAKA